MAARIDHATARLPAPILNDLRGSAAYRESVFHYTLADAMGRLAGAN